jgi:hypothetical protein
MKERITYNISGKEYSYEQNNELVNQLFWALGATLTEIQVFETGMIALLGGIKSKSGIELKKAFEKDESKTLGLLINELINKIEDKEFKDLLIIIRDDRNYIVHKILRKYGWPIMSELQYESAIKEILEIRDIIHNSEPLMFKYFKTKKLFDFMNIEPIIEIIDN